MPDKRDNTQMRIDWRRGPVADYSSSFLLQMIGMRKVEIDWQKTDSRSNKMADWQELVADSWNFQLMIGSLSLQQKTGKVVVEVR